MAKYEIMNGAAIFPEGITVIEREAFRNCEELTSVTIPQSVTEIRGLAFYGCKGLTDIVIPKGVKSLGLEAFAGCSNLRSIVVEEGNPKYDSRDNCNAIIENGTTLILGCCNSIIPVGVTTIGRSAFSGSGLTNVTLPESVKRIEEYAFSGCSSLSEVLIPDTVEEIGDGAFRKSGLTGVVIPENVRNLHGTFLHCNNLKSATVKGKLEDYRADCTFPFMDCPSLETLTFLDCVRYIKEESCNGCKSLKAIYVPAKKGDYYKKRFTDELHPIIIELEPAKKCKK